jgi:hypothetical protein
MDPAAAAQAWLEPRAEPMAALLEALVAIDTQNPPGRGLGRCGRALRDAMAELDLAPELLALAPRGELEEPCVVRGGVGDGPRPSTSTGTSTSSRCRTRRSCTRNGATAGCTGAAPPT